MAFKKGNKDSKTYARELNKLNKPDGYIYILKQKGFDIYKIGVSANPKRRIYDIDSANPFGVEIMCLEWFKNVYELEEVIHDSFSKNELRKEWFKIHREDIKILINQLKEMSSNRIFLIRK